MIKTSSVFELKANEYNQKLAEALKQIPEFKAPEWVEFVKTGMAKKRPPQDPDFWHKRAASILRQAYVRKVVGVNRLKTRYGSKKNRGFKPERFKKASGKIIRVILQQAEAAGLLEEYNEAGKRAGRKLTEKGKELMENIKAESKPKEKPQPIVSQEQSEKIQEDIKENSEEVKE
tara:strand:+ start:591 stop:1115 length:525 start_codon:yes stop_codon:yes gene_type:complete